MLVLIQPVLGQDRARAEFPLAGGTVVIEADRISKETAREWVAEGDAVVTYLDTILKAPRLRYDEETQLVVADQGLEVTRGLQWLRGSAGEFDLTDKTGRIENAEGFTDQELFVKARVLRRTGPDTYVAEDGFLTACDQAIPKWSFTVDRARIRVDSHASFAHTFFKVKKVPVFYFPYMIVPTSRKERSSGLLLPTTGNSTNKGRRISESFYLVLGQSADITLREDYFSRRGIAHGATFRTHPTADTYLEVDAYTIDDRLGQGGTSLNGSGVTRFGEGFRLVADFNLVSNFVFRRVFSDNFFTATRPTEDSRIFLTNNFGARSFNVRVSREETVFPTRNVVTRHTPAFEFKLNGQRLSHLPLYVDLNASAEGLSRADASIETPALIQRLDLYPQIYFSLPLLQGLRVTPRIALRDTFYSDRIEEDGAGAAAVSGRDLNRQYVDFRLDLKGWGLSKVFDRPSGATWKHLIEPQLRYQVISGIGSDVNQQIRFDEKDAIADTHHIELVLFNRFYRKDPAGGPPSEWLSLKLGQKYFLDPDFGGALEEGDINQFFPLNTLTGFPYGARRSNFSPLTGLIRLTSDYRYSFDIRGDYDYHFGRFRNFSITGFLNRSSFSLGTTYFITRDLEGSTFDTNQLQGQIRYGDLLKGFSVASMFSYDARFKQLLNSRTRLNYFWDCCGVALEVERLNVGLREERQIRFSFFLKGIGSFGTIRRPESIF